MLQAVATARVSRDHVYDQLQYVLDQLRDPEVGLQIYLKLKSKNHGFTGPSRNSNQLVVMMY